MQTTVKLYSYAYSEAKTYVFAAMFIVGNILLPQLCHLVPQGGVTWLPIYFFTLVGSYKYGWKVGLLTALLSPVVNSLLCAMPPVSALPAVTIKSVFLALAAGYAASRSRSVSVLLLAAVVLSYQMAGTLAEWACSGSLHVAMQDFRIGLPGMSMQVFGGYLVIKFLIRK